MHSDNPVKLAILASGTGSNAGKICSYFHQRTDIQVTLIITNRKDAGVRAIADQHNLPSAYIPKAYWAHPEIILPVLEEAGVTHIILAGFLLMIPAWLIAAFPGKIINIHPALLPKYGGKGMYGHHVHEAVKSAGDLITGITIHEVDSRYDEGPVLFQKEVIIEPGDTTDDIAAKVLRTEHEYYPKVIEAWLTGTLDQLH